MTRTVVVVLMPLPAITFVGTTTVTTGKKATTTDEEGAVARGVEFFVQDFMQSQYPDNSYQGTTNFDTTIIIISDNGDNNNRINATTTGSVLFRSTTTSTGGVRQPSAEQLRADLAAYLASDAGATGLEDRVVGSTSRSAGGMTGIDTIAVSPAIGTSLSTSTSSIQEVSLLPLPSLSFMAVASNATTKTTVAVGVEGAVQDFLQTSYPDTYIGTTNVITTMSNSSTTTTGGGDGETRSIINATTTGDAIFTTDGAGGGGPSARELQTDLAEYLANDGGVAVLEDVLLSSTGVTDIDNIALDSLPVEEEIIAPGVGGTTTTNEDQSSRRRRRRRFKRRTRIIIGSVVGGLVGLCCCCGLCFFVLRCLRRGDSDDEAVPGVAGNVAW
jgi:hypothetical protein